MPIINNKIINKKYNTDSWKNCSTISLNKIPSALPLGHFILHWIWQWQCKLKLKGVWKRFITRIWVLKFKQIKWECEDRFRQNAGSLDEVASPASAGRERLATKDQNNNSFFFSFSLQRSRKQSDRSHINIWKTVTLT